MSIDERNAENSSRPGAVEQPEKDFLDYMIVLAKRAKLIMAITCAVVAISVVYSFMLTSVYTAKTLIYPGDDEAGMMSAMLSQIGGLSGVAGASFGAPTKTDLYITMLKSEALKDRIIDRFKLMEAYKAKNRAVAYVTLEANTRIVAGKKDGVITISVTDKDPKQAADMANAYVEELGRMAAGISMSNSGKNRQFLEDRLSVIKTDLARAEEALKDFQARNKTFDITEQAKTSIMGVAQLQGQLAVQEANLATLRRQFTDASQEVKSAVATLNATRGELAKLEGKGAESSLPTVGSMPALGQEYIRLFRDFKMKETLLEVLTKQYEMAKFTEMKDVSPVKVIQVATPPVMRSAPSRKKIVLKMLFCSLFLSVSTVLALDFFSRMPDADRDRWNTLLACLPFSNKRTG